MRTWTLLRAIGALVFVIAFARCSSPSSVLASQIQITLFASPNPARAGQEVDFTVTISAPGNIRYVRMDFENDGQWDSYDDVFNTSHSTRDYFHTYTQAGTYTALAEVATSYPSLVGSRTISVIILAPN